MYRAAAWVGCLSVPLLAVAARAEDDAQPPSADVTHPILSTDERWVGPTLAGVGGLFATAAAVGGTAMWLRVRDVVPPASSHEEDPSADHH